MSIMEDNWRSIILDLMERILSDSITVQKNWIEKLQILFTVINILT